jgi:homoserine O-acetyltransferase
VLPPKVEAPRRRAYCGLPRQKQRQHPGMSAPVPPSLTPTPAPQPTPGLTPWAQVEHQRSVFADGMALDCGAVVKPMAVAWRGYGRLNAAKTNAILVCHALTGDQYVAERHPVTGRPGWWETIIGPGRPLDTERYYILCANVLGGCMGSTGPREEKTDEEGRGLGQPWGTDFPPVTIRDMVRAQKKLVDHLGIPKLLAVIGGSMGGMQVLEWAATFPEMVYGAAPIATAAYHSAQNIAFHEVGRAAIHSDPAWRRGRYWEDDSIPAQGLSVARMVAHITYLSEQALTRKFGRRLRGASALTFLEDVFEVESYLRHQGSTFVRRFDANSYLTITRAMDYFDMAAEHGGDLSAAFRGTKTRFFVASFSSDWLFPTSESRALVRALNKAAANVSFVEFQSDKGHDAFLLDEPEFHRALGGFLAGCADRLGV